MGSISSNFSGKMLGIPSFSSSEIQKTVTQTVQKTSAEAKQLFFKACNQLKNVKRDEALAAGVGFLVGAISTAWLLSGPGQAIPSGTTSYSLLNADRSFSKGLFGNELSSELSNQSTWFNVSPVSLASEAPLRTLAQDASLLFSSTVMNSTLVDSVLNESTIVLPLLSSTELVANEIAVNKAVIVEAEVLSSTASAADSSENIQLSSKSDQVLGGGSGDFPVKDVKDPSSFKLYNSLRSIVAGKNLSEYNVRDWINASVGLSFGLLVLGTVVSNVASICCRCLGCAGGEPKLPDVTPNLVEIMNVAKQQKLNSVYKNRSDVTIKNMPWTDKETFNVIKPIIERLVKELKDHEAYINENGYKLRFPDGKIRSIEVFSDAFQGTLNRNPNLSPWNLCPAAIDGSHVNYLINTVDAYKTSEETDVPDCPEDAPKRLSKGFLLDTASVAGNAVSVAGGAAVSAITSVFRSAASSSPSPLFPKRKDKGYMTLSEYQKKWVPDFPVS